MGGKNQVADLPGGEAGALLGYEARGFKLLNLVQDIYLDKSITVARS